MRALRLAMALLVVESSLACVAPRTCDGTAACDAGPCPCDAGRVPVNPPTDAGVDDAGIDADDAGADAGLAGADAGVVELRPFTSVIVAPPALQPEAAELRALIFQSTGNAMDIVPARPDGTSAIELALDGGSAELAVDGFRVSSPDPSTVVITGRTRTGVANGVFDLLERSLGVRWLLPYDGEAGTHVPRHATARIPRTPRIENPGYVDRRLSEGYADPAPWAQWIRHVRMDSSTAAFHHNLYELFPPSRYRLSHPHFYPVTSGVRLPHERDIGAGTDAENHSWQPLLSAPGILDAGVANVLDHFRRNPSLAWFSLGMNDSLNWGDDALAGRPLNSLGYVDMSDPYFRWVNLLVGEVGRVLPGKRFGLLAYHNLADAPSFALEPNVVPYLTYDRMQWLDAARRQRDQLRTTNWARRARELGWYDYVYGDQPIVAGAPIYAVPRIYPHVMAETLAFGHANGVRYYYAEAYPSTDAWTEGPKLYVLSKLLWSPTADVDALLADWYLAAVGPAAAPALARYFAHWEAFWRTRAVQTSWFTRSTGDYLLFTDTSYLDQLTPADRDTLDTAMADVVALAPDGGPAARARLLAHGWQAVRQRAFGPAFDLSRGTLPVGFGRSYAEDMEGPDGGQPSGWLPWTRPNVQTELLANGFDVSNKATGHSALHLSLRALTQQSGMAWSERSVAAGGGTTFCLRSRIRATTDTAGLYLELQAADGGALRTGTRHFAATDGGFVPRVHCLEHPDAGTVRLAVLLETFEPGTASAWFDDVELFAR